jgi:asparagine synthase (glutamine-hydrolysing)
VVRATPDSRYAREVADHVGTTHRAVVLDAEDLLDPGARAAVINARDSPVGWGELDTSLFLLFQAVRQESTVALSGEGADEVFGGYVWLHDPALVAAPTFPWIAVDGDARRGSVLQPALEETLRIEEFRADSLATALAAAPRLDDEGGDDLRRRQLFHLCLTRWLQLLLDRSDRLGMAAGLEVRVPFCDHRLVEYMFNAPWGVKSFDGREKSVLRGAAAELVPGSVLRRRKSLYPSIQSPQYTSAVQDWARSVLADSSSPVGDLLDADSLGWLLAADPAQLPMRYRLTLESVIDLDIWFATQRPALI